MPKGSGPKDRPRIKGIDKLSRTTWFVKLEKMASKLTVDLGN